MFDFWFGLPTIARACLGLVLIGLAVLMFFSGIGRVSVVIGALGLVSLLFCSAGNDDSGYNF